MKKKGKKSRRDESIEVATTTPWACGLLFFPPYNNNPPRNDCVPGASEALASSGKSAQERRVLWVLENLRAERERERQKQEWR